MSLHAIENGFDFWDRANETSDAEWDIIAAQEAWEARKKRRLERLERLLDAVERRWTYDNDLTKDGLWEPQYDAVFDRIRKMEAAKCPIPAYELPERELEDWDE